MAIPRHVAIIMDGNGRWAKQRGKFRISGHKEGIKAVRNAVNFAISHKIEVLTLYAFSSENWRRPPQEVSGLMELFAMALDNEVKKLNKNNVKLKIIGDIKRFSNKLQNKIIAAEASTQHNDALILNIAANYGARWDIVHAAQELAILVQENKLQPDEITEQIFNQHLCLSGVAPVDLMIRTGGEQRISNFLLWQLAYSELYFTDVLWPDFNDEVFMVALEAYAQRERRFGGTTLISNEVN